MAELLLPWSASDVPASRGNYLSFKVPDSTSVVADAGHVGMNVGSEVTQRYQGVGWRGVCKGHSLSSGFVGDEDLVLGHLSEANKRWTVDVQFVELSTSLSDDEAVSPGIANGAACAGEAR